MKQAQVLVVEVAEHDVQHRAAAQREEHGEFEDGKPAALFLRGGLRIRTSLPPLAADGVVWWPDAGVRVPRIKSIDFASYSLFRFPHPRISPHPRTKGSLYLRNHGGFLWLLPPWCGVCGLGADSKVMRKSGHDLVKV